MIYPVVLCGGQGAKLWPVSRRHYPKQFLSIAGADTLLQQTLRRVAGESYQAPVVVCHDEHRFIVAEQLREIGTQAFRVIAEPDGRGTAAAATVAALVVHAKDPDALLAIIPSDHEIADLTAFQTAMMQAAKAALDGRVALLGVAAKGHTPGLGYMRRGGAVPDLADTFEVSGFVEKPSQETVDTYLAAGDALWNCGIVVVRASLLLDEMSARAPAVSAACDSAFAALQQEGPIYRLPAERFTAVPEQSLDHAVIETTSRACVVQTDMGWADVGLWSELWKRTPKDGSGNAVLGDALAVRSKNCYLRGDEKMVAAVGVEDLILVATKDAVLAVSQDEAENVGIVVDELDALGRTEATVHPRVRRPWGSYESMLIGERFQVKILEVSPGAQLSYQLHHHRCEHWIVVSGTARVTLDDKSFLVAENESTYIPVGCKHRVENVGTIPLQIIEVQTGSYLGEDDIVRFEDVYGRAS